MDRLFITGINGLIGHVLNARLAETYDIWGLDITAPFSARIIQADIANYEQVLGAFQRAAPFPILIHLAKAPTAEDWDLILPTNIIGTRNVFEAAREVGVKKVIFASSNHVTGVYEGFDTLQGGRHSRFTPPMIYTTDPIHPGNNYGVSKVFGEALARYYADRWDISFICLRLGSVSSDDDPTRYPRLRKTWLSQCDLVHLVRQSLLAEVTFGIYYGVSANTNAFWDITNARTELGYDPQDNAADQWGISERMRNGWSRFKWVLKTNIKSLVNYRGTKGNY